ncbi:MAG: hypothetical protein QM776_09185 [Rhodocyclaceae bacterium]
MTGSTTITATGRTFRWCGSACCSRSTLFYALRRRSAAAILVFIFCLNGFAHLLLDSVVGDIRWLAPWSQQPYFLFEVTPRYAIWWLNYVMHWFFFFEMAFVMVALTMWRCGRLTNNGVA